MDESNKSTIDDTVNNDSFDEYIEQKKKKYTKKKRILISVGAIAVLSITVIILVFAVIIPNSKYNQAMSLKDNGNMDEAYIIFKDLGNFKDSHEICSEYEYMNAVAMLENGQIVKAYTDLSAITNYEPADNKIEELVSQYPFLEIINAQDGDTVLLGKYEQDNNTANGPEDVEWYVAAHDNGNTLLISKYILDAQQFNKRVTADCTLDDWLSTAFYSKLFAEDNTDENAVFVGLISREDAEKYLTYETRDTEPSAYAKSIQNYEAEYVDGQYSYWMGGSVDAYTTSARASIAKQSYIGNYGDDVTNVQGVRPIIWICPGGKSDCPSNYVYSGKAPSGEKNRSNDSESGSKKGACSGGSVGCREGFHPCGESPDGYCRSCCADPGYNPYD